MTPIVWQDVLDVAGSADGLDATSAGQQTKIIALVQELVNPRAFGGDVSARYLMARSWLAAHFAYVLKNGNLIRGAIQSRSEGGASVSYASLLGTDPRLLALSVYGRQFLALVEVSGFARAGFVIGSRR